MGSSPEAGYVAGPDGAMWNRAIAGKAGRERGRGQICLHGGETAWGWRQRWKKYFLLLCVPM